MTDHDEERDRVAALLAWWRDQALLHKGIVDDLQADVEESWYQLGELDGLKGR